MDEKAKKIKELRESTGINRREFCEYFDIPYRTVTEWERGMRHAPDYVMRLLEYYIRMEKLFKKDENDKEQVKNAILGKLKYDIKTQLDGTCP